MTETRKPVFRRILLKVSGEGLAGKQGFGLDAATMDFYAEEILAVRKLGVEVAVVVGGGNFFRGDSEAARGIERSTADHMGMLATVINSLALQSVLENHGMDTRVMSAIEMKAVCESYIRRRAVRHMEKGRVVIFGGGTGNPYFSTDTAAALRGFEIGADIIMKATKVDGVYNKDPKKHPDAEMYDTITYMDVVDQRLKAMDTTATTMCMENNMPIIVFNFLEEGNLKRVVLGEKVGTTVKEDQ